MNDKRKNSKGASRNCQGGMPFIEIMQKIMDQKTSSACAEKMAECCEGMDGIDDCFSMMRKMMKRGSTRTAGCDKGDPKR